LGKEGLMRHVLTISHEGIRAKLMAWAAKTPVGWRVEFKGPKRSDEQNARMWELLGRISKRFTLNGKPYRPDDWKCVFMHAMGREVRFLPTLDESGFFPSGFRSSDLSVAEMCNLQTFMEQYAAEKGVDIWADEPATDDEIIGEHF
jgi:hypothetical protein